MNQSVENRVAFSTDLAYAGRVDYSSETETQRSGHWLRGVVLTAGVVVFGQLCIASNVARALPEARQKGTDADLATPGVENLFKPAVRPIAERDSSRPVRSNPEAFLRFMQRPIIGDVDSVDAEVSEGGFPYASSNSEERRNAVVKRRAGVKVRI